MRGQPAATGTNIHRSAHRGKSGQRVRVDGLDAGEALPFLRFEVIDERPEHCPQHPLLGSWVPGLEELKLERRHGRQRALPDAQRKPFKVADREVTPSRRSCGHRAGIVHL
ncbi:MAG: hypothetical protein E6J12_01500 [Chloroflexi bacterium]|nr:MAG: hypothetical protein E6J12_01500 [Chloroflexota bacterium]